MSGNLGARRVTGVHLVLPAPGAAAEATFDAGERDAALARWRERALDMAARLGWDAAWAERRYGDVYATVGLTAPVDQLGVACEVLDWAFAGEPSAGWEEQFADEASAARDDHLRALVEQARAAGQPVLVDDDGFTVGLGAHHLTWPLDALPDALPDDLGSIPVVLVTGTNGKTTTTRLLARMAEEAGHCAGHTSSDGIRVAAEWLDTGDWSGPGAARRLLRDRRVTFAVLETARGGMMRRGLAVEGYDVAVVTNVSADHFGEWGLDDVEAMADAKLVVARGLRPGGTLVVNARSEALVGGVQRLGRPDVSVAWFSSAGPGEGVRAWVEGGLLYLDGEDLVRIEDVPLTLGGRAGHNVENVLAAALAARAAGLNDAAIVRALRRFRPRSDDSRGRTNVLRLPVDGGTADVLVDFAHNPDAMRVIADLALAWPARRRMVVLGQPGDRNDALIRAFAAQAARVDADRYVVKELPDHLRGREPGETSTLIARFLKENGVGAERIGYAEDDVGAALEAIDWARDGDLVVLLVHEHFDDASETLKDAGATE